MPLHIFRAGCLAALLFLPLGVAGLEAADRPNVLFLVCDDLNCNLDCYGHPLVESPNLDRLAERGVLFRQAHCQYPLCGPSRASFLTGLYPDQTGIHRNAVFLRETMPKVKTLPQMFRKHGYFATRIGKLYHYSVPAHIGTGGHDDPYSWDATINPRGRDKTDEADVVTLSPGKYGGTLSWLAAEGTDQEQTDGIAATEAIALLQQYAETEQPFFLAVGMFRPHTPYVAPKAYFERYSVDQIEVPEVPEGYLNTLPGGARKSLTRKREQLNLPNETARQAIQAYYASISFVDAQLGRILDVLDATGLAENTIVVLTSDHGYHMGEHGHYQKTTLFEDATRVPLLIAGPGVEKRGLKTDALAELIDLYPTLAELCGVTPPKGLPGVSLAPVCRGTAEGVRDDALSQYADGYSLRTDRYRYTLWSDGGAELYDHQHDPQEMNNLAGDRSYREIEAELAHRLRVRSGQTEVDLFPGGEFSLWRTDDGEPVVRGWTYHDGVVHLKPTDPRAGHILTEPLFGDFELSFQWKIAPGGNSGVKYRVRHYVDHFLGCEYQIYDGMYHGYRVDPRKVTASIYNLFEPRRSAHARADGEYNDAVIRVEGDRIEHWLNGTLATSAVVGGPDWRQRISESKFCDVPGFAQDRFGRIMLTDHGSEVWYRDIRLKLLPLSKQAR